MAGITGWVDFARDLRLECDVVRAMTATLAARGPDSESIWSAPHAVLGHRGHAVLDAAGSGQPMAAVEAGQTLAVVAYNGEIWNAAEVRAELAARGSVFRSGGDTEVVLRAYLEWGEKCPEHLDGMFAFAAWDCRRQQLLLARDHMGIKPLYYLLTGTGVLFGSEIKAILAHPLAEPAVDIDGLREVLGFAGTPGAEVFRCLRRMLPGHTVRVSADGTRERRYWSLTARPHTDDRATTVATIREMLEEAVARRLIADAPLCVLLSGGVDSGAAAALAARALRNRGESLRTFTVSFTADAAESSIDPQRGSLDAPYAEEVARHIGARHTHVIVGPRQLSDPVMRRRMLSAQQDMPYPVAEALATMYLLCRSVRPEASVAITGEWADDVFGSYLGMDDPDTIDSGTLPWVAFAQKYACATGLGTGLFDTDLLKRLDLPGYCADRYRQLLTAVPRLDSDSAPERRMREFVYLQLSGWFELGTAMNDGVSMAAGVEWRSPYGDHQLIEYMFNVPWEMKAGRGERKRLLREAVADLLPKSVLERRPSPFPVTHDPAYARYLREELAQLLADSHAPVLPLLNVAAARRVADDTESLSEGWRARTNVEMVLQTNAWLDQYRVRLV